jgi:hypothetical protein
MKRLLSALGSLFLSVTGCQKNSAPPVETGPVEWVAEALPLPADTDKLWINVIRGTGSDDIWLLTNANINRVQDRLVFHYDGTKWENVTPQMPSRARDSIFPISKTDVWAVGKQGTAAHYDGKTWTVHQIPNFYFDFVDVFARPNDVWIADIGPRVVHYDGKTWNILTPPELADNSVHVLWGTDKEILVPVNPKEPPSRMARFDGTKWSSEIIGPGGLTLIHGSSPTDVWALSRRNQGYHFDGKTWTRVPTLDQIPLWSLSVAGPNSAFAAGDDGIIMRWDGKTWQKSPTGTRERLVSVYAPANGKALAGGAKLYRQK